MGNNNRNNNRNQGQQRQAQQAEPTDQNQNEQGTELELEDSDLDSSVDLGTLTAAPNGQSGDEVVTTTTTTTEDDKKDDVIESDKNDQAVATITTATEAPVVDGQPRQGEYVPPVQESTQPEQQPDPAGDLNNPAPTPTVVPPSLEVPREEEQSEANLVPDPAKVLAAEMISEDGTIVTQIMLRRLEKHMKFLRGKLAFRDKNEQFEEQVTWIDTVGNSLNLDYPQYVLVTKAILAEMLQDVNLFRDGGAYRFLQSVKGKYPVNAIEGYEAYMTFLTRVVTNWSTRHRLRSSVDIAFPVSRIPTAKGKENLTKFFNSLVK